MVFSYKRNVVLKKVKLNAGVAAAIKRWRGKWHSGKKSVEGRKSGSSLVRRNINGRGGASLTDTPLEKLNMYTDIIIFVNFLQVVIYLALVVNI